MTENSHNNTWWARAALRLRKVFSVRLVLLVLLMAGLYCLIGCPIHYFTGIPCPGCGMTRAILSLLRLDLGGALYYHPLVFLLPVPVLLLFVKKGPPAYLAVRTGALYAAGALFIGVYLYRLFGVQGGVVAIEFSPFLRDVQAILTFGGILP